MGDGSRVKIWANNWIRGESLRELIEGPLNQGDLDLTVADLRHEGIWNWDGFSFVIPKDIKDKIRAIPFRICDGVGDFIMWKFSKDREFSVKLAYQVARQEENNGISFQGSWIWKLDILPKIIHFLWLSFHCSIPMHGVLASRGINCNKRYPLCKCSKETIPHLLRDCNLTHDFWRKLEPPPALISTFNDSCVVES